MIPTADFFLKRNTCHLYSHFSPGYCCIMELRRCVSSICIYEAFEIENFRCDVRVCSNYLLTTWKSNFIWSKKKKKKMRSVLHTSAPFVHFVMSTCKINIVDWQIITIVFNLSTIVFNLLLVHTAGTNTT